MSTELESVCKSSTLMYIRNEIYKIKAKGKDKKWHQGYITKVVKREKEDLSDACCLVKDSNETVWVCEASTICRFTGLQDKLKDFIWEYDIVRCTKRGAAFNCCVVIWNPQKGRYDILNEDLVSFPMIIDDFNDDIKINENDYEIIGNVYDNSNLFCFLESKKK